MKIHWSIEENSIKELENGGYTFNIGVFNVETGEQIALYVDYDGSLDLADPGVFSVLGVLGKKQREKLEEGLLQSNEGEMEL